MDDSTRIDSFRIKRVVPIFASLIAIIVLDLSLLRLYDSVSKQVLTEETRLVIFSVMLAGCAISGLLLLSILSPPKKAKESGSERISRKFYYITTVVLLGLYSIMTFVLFEMLFLQYYDTVGLIALVGSSNLLCLTIIVVLLMRIISRLPLGKTVGVILLFISCLATIALNIAAATTYAILCLDIRPDQTRPSGGGGVDICKGKFDPLPELYMYTYLLSYLTSWAATALLLLTYRHKLGLSKTATLMAAPLLFVIFQFPQYFLMILPSFGEVDQFLLNNITQFIILLSKPVAGIMLGLQFWIIAGFAEKGSAFRFFLIVAGFGLLLLFSSNQAILISLAPYPPVGLATITVTALASYFVMIGLYRSTLTISSDHRLRREIYQVARSEAMLIEGILSGEKRKEIEDKVTTMVHQRGLEIVQDFGSTPSLTEQDVKEQVNLVLRELKKID